MEQRFAHTFPGGEDTWQTLEDHLHNVATLSEKFAAAFAAGNWGKPLGWLHDIGKASREFQARLRGRNVRVDHATAGGQYAFDLGNKQSELAASLLAYPVMGHHGGLPHGGLTRLDTGSLRERLFRQIPDYRAGLACIPVTIMIPDELPSQILGAPEEERGFATAFFIRMLFSCLVDADWLDTERFCNPGVFARRPVAPALGALRDELDNFMASLGRRKSGNAAIASLRQEVLDHCRQAARSDPGCFSLTVPTGGGKTLSSLAFALQHAILHGMDRIVYVIPFTSIIEQNAGVFRRALGEFGHHAVLEHHSSYSASDTGRDADSAESSLADQVADLRLATQNWDASIVVTTAVQFFESLYACKPSQCRKLHNLARSVVVLDEAQMLPPDLLNPCVMALRELNRGYGTSVVLCTATQPALEAAANLNAGFAPGEIQEIIPPARLPILFKTFERVTIDYAGVLDTEALVSRLMAEHQSLCIVNTRKRARELYSSLGVAEGHYHLSALMYPEHRRRKLQEIRERLDRGKVCRVISTSLIEAGVDVDFPSVFREETGLDSIAQAAGRCNREGLLAHPGRVTIFTPDSGLPRAPFFRRRAAAAAWVREHFMDLLSPEAIQAYFQRLYRLENLDSKNILPRLNDSLDEDLEEIPVFPFRDIAADFTFIEDGGVSVIIEQGDALELLQRLETEEDRESVRNILQQLQSFSVQVYPSAVSTLPVRVQKRYGMVILSGATGYSDDFGLNLDDPFFRDKENNIF